ncbi:hypothetical protein GGF32_008297 [Allomyces javanicus]|nr:hypothetical protein GGF32_008297 [Allomyces javanicus]
MKTGIRNMEYAEDFANQTIIFPAASGKSFHDVFGQKDSKVVHDYLSKRFGPVGQIQKFYKYMAVPLLEEQQCQINNHQADRPYLILTPKSLIYKCCAKQCVEGKDVRYWGVDWRCVGNALMPDMEELVFEKHKRVAQLGELMSNCDGSILSIAKCLHAMFDSINPDQLLNDKVSKTTKFSSGALGKQGFDEFHPNKDKKLKLDDNSGVRSIDPGHNNFLTVFEATTAQVRAILANNVPPNYIQDKIRTWDRKSDSPAERAECMFWDMAGHRTRQLTGQSNLTKRLTQFWTRNPILKLFMDSKPTLKTHQMHETLAVTRYMSSRLHSVMQRVLCSFVAKMTFRKNNRERSFWDALVARLMKPISGSTKPVLIMFGNAGASNPRGCSMPVKQFIRRLVHAGAQVMLVDEYYTSKKCAVCGVDLVQDQVAWGSKHCKGPCRRVISRDRNAAFNIFRAGIRDGIVDWDVSVCPCLK